MRAYDYELSSKLITDAIATVWRIADGVNGTELALIVECIIALNEARAEMKKAKEVSK